MGKRLYQDRMFTMNVVHGAQLTSVVVSPSEHVAMGVDSWDVGAAHFYRLETIGEFGLNDWTIFTWTNEWGPPLDCLYNFWRCFIQIYESVTRSSAQWPAPKKQCFTIIDYRNSLRIIRSYWLNIHELHLRYGSKTFDCCIMILYSALALCIQSASINRSAHHFY